MFKVKPYVILVTLVGTLLLVYGMTFLSSKVFPIADDRSSGQLILTLTESILAFGALMAVIVGCTFYYMKSRFEDHSHKH